MRTARRVWFFGALLTVPHELSGWAALPQQARTPGPTCGQFIKPAHGVTPPFEHAQPIPGFSGLLAHRDGSFIAMPDNGFGTRANSGDFVLGFYRVRPAFKTRADGGSSPGALTIESFTAFRDSKGLLANGQGVDLAITADSASYPGSTIAVDASIREGRLLTGSDFDVESIARAKDGSYWVGDEFGPYLLHFAADGVLLEEPVAHPTLKSPSHPDVLAGKASATLGSSRGFEALAFDAQQRFLYALPEAAPTVDNLRAAAGDERVVQLFQFDTRSRRYTGRTFAYRKDGDARDNQIVIGDMTHVGGRRYVLIERDTAYGASARLKRLYIIDLDVSDACGVLHKRLLVDLLNIDDPRDLGGELPGLAVGKFNMPFDSLESLAAIDARTLAIAIDTNFPGQDARTAGVPDSSEVIVLRFPRPVSSYAPRR